MSDENKSFTNSDGAIIKCIREPVTLEMKAEIKI